MAKNYEITTNFGEIKLQSWWMKLKQVPLGKTAAKLPEGKVKKSF